MTPTGVTTGLEGFGAPTTYMASGKREIAGAYADTDAAMMGTPELKRTRVAPDVGGFSLGPPEGSRSRGNRFAPAAGPRRIDGSLIARLRGFSSASGRLQGMPPSPKSDDNHAQQQHQHNIGEGGNQYRPIDDGASVAVALDGGQGRMSTSSMYSSPPSPMDIIEGNKQRVVTSSMMSSSPQGRGRRRSGSSSRGGSQHGQQSPERPFGCPECPTWFGRKDNLKKHIRMIHLNERPFPCELCGYPFQKKDHLHKHVSPRCNSCRFVWSDSATKVH